MMDTAIETIQVHVRGAAGLHLRIVGQRHVDRRGEDGHGKREEADQPIRFDGLRPVRKTLPQETPSRLTVGTRLGNQSNSMACVPSVRRFLRKPLRGLQLGLD